MVCSRKFQFYKVRLKPAQVEGILAFDFQISILQSPIKAISPRASGAAEIISILQSPIKALITVSTPSMQDHFNSTKSD